MNKTTDSAVSSVFDRIYELTCLVPEGRVVTYGDIAKALHMSDVRKVGWALHANKNQEVPCHRVVNKEGRLAKNFAFDGEEEQRRRLEAEGVEFLNDGRVNLDMCRWNEFNQGE
jgi:methylated-DNA-protein-cysteine methyltransferase-like protein